MQLFSTSEYEFGFIALGATPVGFIAIGAAPVGVIAIGLLPLGVLSFACGIGVGIGNYTCGIGLGGYVRATGIALGANASAVGLGLPLGGSGRSSWYWSCMALVTAAVSVLLFDCGRERIAITKMNRVVDVTWKARPAKSEGLFIAPETECRVEGRLRSDGVERLHARLRVICGSLELVERRIRSGCELAQIEVEEGHAYALRCEASRIAATTGEDSSPEVPGLVFDTLESPGRARIHAVGPPPMNVELEVDAPGQAVSEVDGADSLLEPGVRIRAATQ